MIELVHPLFKVDDCLIPMEVDTGASMSLMSEHTFRRLWPRRSLVTTGVTLVLTQKNLSQSKESVM